MFRLVLYFKSITMKGKKPITKPGETEKTKETKKDL
jgi:hypothetical protein